MSPPGARAGPRVRGAGPVQGGLPHRAGLHPEQGRDQGERARAFTACASAQRADGPVPASVVQIPMFIVTRRDVERNGANPTLLYGYGGFNISITPSYRQACARTRGGWCVSVAEAPFTVVADAAPQRVQAHVPGGTTAALSRSRTSAAAASTGRRGTRRAPGAEAELLRRLPGRGRVADRRGHTSPPKLCIEGGSNGGLLVAACVNQVRQRVSGRLPARRPASA